jgi:hypothetical protein
MKHIQLTNGYFAIVDDEDYERLSKYSWYILKKKNGQIYARRGLNIFINGKRTVKTVYMHRVITQPHSKLYVDHINGNGLDNRRFNLRTVTNTENLANRHRLSARNSSGVNGVSWDKRHKCWRAELRRRGRTYFIGRFSDIVAASESIDRFKAGLS